MFVMISIRAVLILHEARHANGDFGVGAKPELEVGRGIVVGARESRVHQDED